MINLVNGRRADKQLGTLVEAEGWGSKAVVSGRVCFGREAKAYET